MRLETTVIKTDVTYQRRVDKTQALLLAATYEVGTKDLKIVHIDKVLIIAASTYIVL